MPSIMIDKRFCGPPNSGNGGYVCGLLAAHIGGSGEITLRAPPLGQRLDIVPLYRVLLLEAGIAAGRADGIDSVRCDDGLAYVPLATLRTCGRDAPRSACGGNSNIERPSLEDRFRPIADICSQKISAA